MNKKSITSILIALLMFLQIFVAPINVFASDLDKIDVDKVEGSSTEEAQEMVSGVEEYKKVLTLVPGQEIKKAKSSQVKFGVRAIKPIEQDWTKKAHLFVNMKTVGLFNDSQAFEWAKVFPDGLKIRIVQKSIINDRIVSTTEEKITSATGKVQVTKNPIRIFDDQGNAYKYDIEFLINDELVKILVESLVTKMPERTGVAEMEMGLQVTQYPSTAIKSVWETSNTIQTTSAKEVIYEYTYLDMGSYSGGNKEITAMVPGKGTNPNYVVLNSKFAGPGATTGQKVDIGSMVNLPTVKVTGLSNDGDFKPYFIDNGIKYVITNAEEGSFSEGKATVAYDSVQGSTLNIKQVLKINFNPNGGKFGESTNNLEKEVFFREKVTDVAEPTKNVKGVDYTFVGWTKDSTPGEDSPIADLAEPQSDNETYYAVWKDSRDVIPVLPKDPDQPFNPENPGDDNNNHPLANDMVRIVFDANQYDGDGGSVVQEGSFGKYEGKETPIKKIAYDIKNTKSWGEVKSIVPTTIIPADNSKKFADWVPSLPGDDTTVKGQIYTVRYTDTEATKAQGKLTAKDLLVWKGQDVKTIKWEDGVTVSQDYNNGSLLAETVVTDKSGRNTDSIGTQNGELLVTFKDNSSLTITNQNLIVKDNVIKDDGDAPKDAVTVTFTKGEGVTKLNNGTENVTYKVQPNYTLKDIDFPTVEVNTEEYGDTVTWTPKNRVVTESNKNFTATAKKKVIDLNPGEEAPEGYVKLTFDATSKGTINSQPRVTEKSIGVLKGTAYKDGELVKKIEAIKAVPTDEAQIFDKWNPLVPTDNAYVKEGTFTANYKAKSNVNKVTDPNSEIPAGFVRIIFDATDQGTFAADRNSDTIKQVIFDVKEDYKWGQAKAEGLVVPRALFKKDESQIFDKWDKDLPADTALVTVGAEAKKVTFTATYKQANNVIEDPTEQTPAGFVRITFKPTENGTFNSDKATGLNIDKVYDVKEDIKWGQAKADGLVVPSPIYKDDSKIFDKWNPALPKDTAVVNDGAKEFTAQYKNKSTVLEPENPDKEVTPGYTKIIFDATDAGTINGQTGVTKKALEIITGTKYSNPEVQTKIAAIKAVPKDTSKKFDKWDNPVPKDETTVETKTYTAQYVVNKDAVPQDGDHKPAVPENFVKVEFSADTDKASLEGTKIYWVNPEKEVTLKAPTVTIKEGKTSNHTGWTDNTKNYDAKYVIGTFTEEQGTSLTATFSDDTVNKPVIEKARNIGENPAYTTVEGKVQDGAGATITIKTKGGDVLGNPVIVKEDGSFIAIVPIQTKGTELVATATKGKASQDSDPVAVIIDKNNDGKDDETQPFNPKTVVSMTVGNPTKLDYLVTTKEGKANFKTAGMVVVLTDELGKTQEVQEANFGTNHITIKPENGEELGIANNNTKVTATYTFTPDGQGQTEQKIKADAPGLITVRLDANNNGTADEEEGFNKERITKLELVNDPAKMNYVHEETLDLEGILVIATDDLGKVKVYRKADLETDGLTVTPAHGAQLSAENTPSGNNGQKIEVSKMGVNQSGAPEKIKVETSKALKVIYDDDKNGKDDREEKTILESITASNIGPNPQGTTIKGKAEPKSTVTVKDGSVTVATILVNDSGDFEATTNSLLPKGKTLTATAKIGRKLESDPKQATVFIDANSDGIDDAIVPGAPKATARNIGENPQYTTVEGTAKAESLVTITTQGGEVLGKVYADAQGKFNILVKKQDAGTTLELVSTKDGETSPKGTTVVFDDKDNNGVDDKTEQTPVPTDVKARNVGKDPDKTTVTGKAVPGATVTVKNEAGDQTLGTTTAKSDGSFTVELRPMQNADTVVKVSAKDGDKIESDKVDAGVFTDKDDNGTDDKTEKTPEPTEVKARNIGDKPTKTTITGKSVPGAKITVKNAANTGEALGTTTAGEDGSFKLEIDKLEVDTVVRVSAKDGEKQESEQVLARVFPDVNDDGKDDRENMPQPVVNPISNGATKITGTIDTEVAKAGAKVQVTLEDGSQVTVNVDPLNGTWSVTTKELKVGQKVTVVAKDTTGKKADSLPLEKEVGNANSEETIIPYIPTSKDNPTNPSDTAIPTKDAKGNVVVKDQYEVVAFVSDPKDGGKLSLGNVKAQNVISALVKKGVDWSAVEKPTPSPENGFAFLKWIKGDAEPSGTVTTGDVVKAKFVKTGDEIGNNDKDKLPPGWFAVSVTRDENSIAEDDLYGKIYVVQQGNKLVAEKFPKVTAKKDFKEAAWYVGEEKVPTPAEKVIQGHTIFVAKAIRSNFDDQNITDFVISKEPKLTYNGGEAFDPTGIEVTLTDKYNNTLKVTEDQLAANGITLSPVKGAILGADQNDQKIRATKVIGKGKSIFADSTNPLVVETQPTKLEPISIGDKQTKVTGITDANADVTITIPGEDKPIKIKVKANEKGEFEVTTPIVLNAGDVVTVEAQAPYKGKAEQTITVGLDTDGLKKAIEEGNTALVGETEETKTPEDKALEKAISDGQAVLDKTTDEDQKNNPKQGEVDKAKQDILDAIKAKEERDVLDKELADLIGKAEDRLTKDDVTGGEDGTVPKKPAPVIKEVKDSKDEGKTRDNTSKTGDVKKSIERIEKALEEIDKDALIISANGVDIDQQQILIYTFPGKVTVKVYINGKYVRTVETNSFGVYGYILPEPIQKGFRIKLEASKEGYISNVFSKRVR